MYLKVLATPSARKESVGKESPTAWRISVREPAQGNAANNRIKTLVARELNVPLSSVRILTGHHSGSKLLSIDT